MPTKKQSQRKRHLGIKFALFISYTAPLGIALLHASLEESALAQLIPDTTLGVESSTVTSTSLTVEQINGGATRGANLFHSFQEFNVGVGRGVYFSNPAGIENILTRVTGTNPSNILGKLGVLGNANLFLLNPNGIIFGSGASLDINGSFVASTANAFTFADGTFFSATNPQAQPLLTINVPIGLQFGTNQPAAIVNAGTLAVKPEQNLSLMGGTVVSTGQLEAPGGQLVVETVPGSEIETVPSSSLSELLTIAGDETGLTVNSSGGVELRGSSIPVEAGDVVVRQLNAGTATLSASNNLILLESQLQTSGDLNLLAQDTVRVLDSLVTPFIAQAGGKLLVQGNQEVNIFALNHSASGFFSNGDMVLRSSNTVRGDAHYTTGGNFEIEQLDGSLGNLYSPDDPVIMADGDVELASYLGASLHILAGGKVNIPGNVKITGVDTVENTINPLTTPTLANVTLSDGTSVVINGNAQPTLDIRAGIDWTLLGGLPGNTVTPSTPLLTPSPTFNTTPPVATSADIKIGSITNNGGLVFLTNQYNPNTLLPGGAIEVGWIDTSQEFANGGDILIDSRSSIALSSSNYIIFSYGGSSYPNGFDTPGSLITSSAIGNGGNITLNATGDITIINELRSHGLEITSRSGDVTLKAGGNITLPGAIFSSGREGGDVTLTAGGNISANYIGTNANTVGGNITLISSGFIDTKLETQPNTYTLYSFGNIGGAITLSASNDIITSSINSGGNLSGSDIILTSGGVIDTSVSTINSFGRNANSGAIAFAAVGDITTGNLISQAQGLGNGGKISLNSQTGDINTTAGEVSSTSNGGNAGAITFSTIGNITTGNLESRSLGVGNGGDIRFNSNGIINTTVGTLDSSSLLGNAGTVSLEAASNLTTGNISSSSSSGTGGAISLSSSNGAINTTSSTLASSSINGDAGAISLEANGEITTGLVKAEGGSVGGGINFNSSNSNIDTTSGELNSSSAGDAGAIALEANGNIITSNITSASGSGTGGDISLTSGDGEIDTTSGNLNSSSVNGNAGAIILSASKDITTGTISSESVSGTGGNINLTSDDGQIDTTSGDLISSSIGNAGSISLEGRGNIITSNIYSYSYANGTGGDIHLNSSNGDIDTTRGDLNSSSFSGNAGAISLEAYGNITSGSISAVGGNSGGNLTIASNARFSSVSSLILSDTFGAGKAGDINIEANSVTLTDGTRVSASSRGAGPGGNIRIRASESVELSSTNNSRSFISTDASASGDAGNLLIETGRLSVRDGSGISATAMYGSTGRGGKVTVYASDSVDVSGTTLDGRPSLIGTGTAGTKPAGDLTINTRQLVIRDGAIVLTSTVSPVSEGVGGNLTVNASESVELSGISANSQVPSALSTDTAGSAKAGDLRINTRQFIAHDGAAASVSSFGEGQSGNLTLDASESVDLRGTSASGLVSGLYAQAFASGNAGNLIIRTRDLKVQDGANVTVASRSASDTRFPRVRTKIDLGDGVRFSLPTDTIATGDAGTLKIEADTIFLNRQGSLIASTASGEGGNIDLEAQNYILMRHNSLISAEAGKNGNGGNITINTLFVIGFKQENSDIIANAFQGRGGNIYITVEGIYGLKFRPRLTPFSDITASSEVEGQDGIVEINTPAVDPTQSLTNLPTDFEEPPMKDSCQASGKTASSFAVTGRGGLPPSPDDLLSSDPDLVGLVIPVPRRQNPYRPAGSANSASSTPNTIVEAQGWIVAADGTVTLTAQAPRVTPYTPAFTSANCQAHRERARG